MESDGMFLYCYAVAELKKILVEDFDINLN